jgi:hypothetical protein
MALFMFILFAKVLIFELDVDDLFMDLFVLGS